jgi:hypothetical protein
LRNVPTWTFAVQIDIISEETVKGNGHEP